MGAFREDFTELSPVFGPLLARSPGLAKLGRFPSLAEFNAEAERLGLVTADGRRLTFVAAPKKRRRKRRKDPDALPYELRVAVRGEVETRDESWHDFFNALTWTAFPDLKAALNGRQIAARQAGMVRSREQDRLAMFDEGGVLRQRGPSGETEHFVVGHALYESLIEGKTGIRALVLDVDLPEGQAGESRAVRAMLAQRAGAARIAGGCFADVAVVWPDCLLDEVAR